MNHGSWPSTRTTLLSKLRDAENSDAWRRFVDLYGPLVFRYCRRRGLQEADAAEVTQDVVIQVWQSMPTFRYERARGGFRNWLGTVTRNRVIRQWKSDRRRSTTAETFNIPSREAETIWEEESRQHLMRTALRQIQSSFEPRTWRAFELCWVEDRAALDVARELQMPIDRVYVAKSRVLKKLDSAIRKLAEDDSAVHHLNAE